MKKAEPSGRKLRAMESKSRIYEAAIAVITEKGFEEASIKEIVARAGVSVGAFYHHFASKDAVLEENFRLADDRFAHLTSQAGAETGILTPIDGATAADRIVDYLGLYGRFVEKVAGLDFSRRLYTPRTKLFVKKGRPMQTVLAALIAEGVASGELKTDLSSAQASEWLFVGARGVAFHWCLMDGRFDLEKAMREYTRRALRGLEPLSSDPSA